MQPSHRLQPLKYATRIRSITAKVRAIASRTSTPFVRHREVASPSTDASDDIGCTLPQEIVDIIIDHLASDPATLKQCSLVCRDWVPRSSTHLFSRFIWPECRAGKKKKCVERRLGGEHCFVRCLQALGSSTRVCSYIRTLLLMPHSCSPTHFGRDMRRGGISISCDTLYAIVALLPHLQVLTLIICRPLPLRSAIDMRRDLQLLSILHYEDTLQGVADVLAMFRHVKKLDLGWRPLARPALGSPFIPVTESLSPSTVDVLNLRTTLPPAHEDAVSRSLGAVELRSLHTFHSKEPLTPELVAAIKPLAATIQRLTYAVHDAWPLTGLPECPRLTAVTLRTGLSLPHSTVDWHIVLRDLGHLVHLDMQDICIEIITPTGPSSASTSEADVTRWMSSLDWWSLEAVLRRCPAFRRLVFRLSTELDSSSQAVLVECAVDIIRQIVEQDAPKWISEKTKVDFGR